MRSPEGSLTKLHDLARMICTRAGLVRPMIYVRKQKRCVIVRGTHAAGASVSKRSLCALDCLPDSAVVLARVDADNNLLYPSVTSTTLGLTRVPACLKAAPRSHCFFFFSAPPCDSAPSPGSGGARRHCPTPHLSVRERPRHTPVSATACTAPSQTPCSRARPHLARITPPTPLGSRTPTYSTTS